MSPPALPVRLLADAPVERVGLSALFGVLAAPASVTPTGDHLSRRVTAYFQGVEDVVPSLLTVCDRSVVVLSQGGPRTTPFVLVRGVPVGATGEATDDEIRALLSDPYSDTLAGIWSLAWVSESHVRIVTSRAAVHVLAEASGPHGTAWGSRNDLALLLSGADLRLARDRAPEYVALDYVLGSDELLDQGRILAEGAIVDAWMTGSGTTWNRLERPVDHGSTGETGGEQLRAVVGDVAARCARVDDAMLALTAGRDSALLLSCMAERNTVPPTFTMGWRDLPDARGAAAIARAMGAPHHVTVATAYDGTSIASMRRTQAWIRRRTRGAAAGAELFRPILRWSRWTQGLDHPRNLLIGWIRWPTDDFVAITGSGGEIGRAFYWHRTEGRSAADALTADWRAVLHPDAWERYRARVEAELSTRPDVVDSAAALDLVYVYGRMRKWLNRGAAFRGVRGTLFPYLEPDVVAALLSIPRQSRLDGSVFDAALAATRPNLHHLGRANSQRRLWRLPRTPLSRWIAPLPSDWPALQALVMHCMSVSDLHERLFRREWWERSLASGSTDPTVRPPLWNYVGVVAAEQAWDGWRT